MAYSLSRQDIFIEKILSLSTSVPIYMRKFIISLIFIIIAGALGIGGWLIFKDDGPRERVDGENGTKVIVEELSYYSHGKKLYGKVFKPADENGTFSDSLGRRPAVIFLHEPLHTALPQSTLASLSSHGIIGYMASLHEPDDAETVLKKIREEKYVEKDLIFLVADSTSSEAVLGTAAKNRKKVAGVALIGPSEELLKSKNMRKFRKDALVVSSDEKSTAARQILEYLESHGALK